MKNTKKSGNPNADLRSEKENTYNHGSSTEVAAVLWPIQVDAAVKVDRDEELCDGGGARAAVGLREEEDGEREEWERLVRVYL